MGIKVPPGIEVERPDPTARCGQCGTTAELARDMAPLRSEVGRRIFRVTCAQCGNQWFLAP